MENLTVLAVPPGEAGEALLHHAETAVSEVEIHPATSAEDVILYREVANLPLNELPHLGPAGPDRLSPDECSR